MKRKILLYALALCGMLSLTGARFFPSDIHLMVTSQDQVNIDIAGLPNGWYQLLLVQDGEIIETDNVLLNK